MKKLALLVLVLGSAAMAAPIACGSLTDPYTVFVASDYRSATVRINGEVPDFGELVCESPIQELGDKVFLICSSPHVADAGYQATFSKTDVPTESVVQLDEFWIGGTHHRATLPCVHAQD